MSYAEHRAKISGTFPAKTSVSSYAEYRKKKDDELITSWLKSAATAQDITNKHLSSSSYGDWSGSSGNVRNRLDAISSQSNEVRAALERNKTSYDAETYKKLTDAVNSYGSYFSAATSGVKRQSEYFSQFGSEDDYNAAIEANKRRQKQSTMTTSDVKKEIESLKTKKDEYKESDDRTKLSDVVGSIFNSKDFSDTKDEYKAGRKKIADYSSQIAEYTNVQKEKEFDDKYGKLINNSTYASKYTPDKTINDEKYKYINDVDGFRNKYAEEVKAAAKSGRFRGGSDYVVYDKLTDKEVSAYNYLYTSQGKKAADEFLDAMQEKYAESVAEDIYTGKLGGGLKGNAAAELGYSVVAGADQFVSGIKGTGKWLNENDEATPTSTAQYVRSMVREDLGDKEQHPILAGKSILGNTVGQTIYDLGTTIANMAPSILAGSLITFATGGLGAPAAIASTVGSAVGAASLGTSAAGNDYNEKIKAGYSPEQAGTHAMLVGASESALQYLLGGVGGVSSKAGSNALKSVLSKSGVEALNKISNVLDNVFVKYLIDAGSEFTEEYLQEVLTPVFDNIVLDDNKEIKLFSEEALYSGILGALTAGAINAPSAISSITENRNTPKADITKQPDAMTTTPPIIEAEDITATTSDVNPVSDVEVTDDTLLTEYSKSFGKYADVFSNSYTQGTDIDTYETEFRKAFNNGRSGTTLDYTKRSNTLLPKQIEAAFTAGQDYAKEQAKMKKDVFSGVKRPGYVKLEEGIKAATLEPKQKASLSAIRSIATVSGVNFEFFQSKPDENGSYANYENGSYDAKTNTIRIDLNAGKYGVNIGDYAILRTASHELTHFIKNNSTEQFKALSDFTVAMLTEFEGKSIEDLVLAKQSNSRRTELSYDDALEEVIADGCEMMLKDSAAVEMLAKENKSLYNSVKNFVKSFVNAVKKAFQGVEANTEEAKAMMKYADALQVVWDNALVQSVRNYNASEPSQVEQGKKFSMRNSEEETDKLVAVHNLTEKNLLDSLELGGLPMPSVAIVKARQGHTKYGEISLVFNKNAIDPAVLKSNKIYGGDAWTPTYPTVEYKVNSSVADTIIEKISTLLKSANLNNAFGYLALDEDNISSYLNRNDGDVVRAYRDKAAFKAAYLIDSNVDFDVPTKEKDLSNRFDNGVVVAVANHYGAEKINQLYNGGYKSAEGQIDTMSQIVDSWYEEEIGKPIHFDFGYSDFDSLIGAARRYLSNGISQEVDASAAEKAIDGLIDEQKYEKWLNRLFEGIVEKKGIRNNATPYTPSGNRKSFEALHYEENLENVIKVMKQREAKGDDGFSPDNLLFANATKEYKNISEVRADKERIGKISEDEYSELKNEYQKRFIEIASSIADKSRENQFIAIDGAALGIIDAVVNTKSRAGMLNTLKEYYGKATEDTVTDIIELVQNISSMPTEYFEAKPRRAVYFKEVAAAIIPDNSSDNLKSKLNNIKIPVVEYSANNEESRLEALNSVEGVKFSERDSEYLELAKDPEKNESKLRDMVDDVAKAAGYTIKAYHGTKKDFNIFDIGKNTNNTMLGRGFYFAKDPDVVQRYGNRKISAYLKLSNPLNISGVNLNSVLYALRNSVSGTVDVNLMLSDGRYANGVNTKKLTEFIKSNGYDGISENTKGYYVVFDSDQIKSADPVTYDNSGKVIPLSVRFNSNSKDIRYSERDSEKRLIYGNAEGQMYEISETDKYRMTGTKHGSVLMVPQNNTDSVKIYGVMRTSGFVNGAYVGDENINTLFSNGRIVMNNDSYNNNTRAKVTSIIKREISMLGGTYSSGTYYRVTDNPKEIELLKSGKIKKSINHMNGKEENGLSVWEIPKYTGKYIYRVSGDVTTIGSDHEPVLDISSVKFVEEVDFKKLRRDDASGKDLFSKIYNWSFRQIDNAIDGIYEKSELKYQDRTPEYTNRQILVNALENDNLSDEGKAEAINALKSRLNLTDGRDIDADTVNTIAGNLLKSYKSKYGVDRLQSDLSELYGGVSDNVSWDEMLKKSELIASNILKNSTAKNDDIQYTKEILGVIRKTPIRLSSTQEQEAAFSVGGTINDFRKKNFGNFIISKDGIPLDTWWNQLSEMYPDVFDSDVTEGDQITSLADICEMLRTPQDISSDIVADVGKKILSGALEFPEYTNRFILSNALSHIDGLSVADQNRLNIYKKDLDKLNGYETELSEVKKQIHDIAFTKGTDRTRLKALYQRADTLRSAIKDADKTLLRVEAMEPIKKLVESERKEIDKRITADSKQRLSDYRDKATIEKINKKVKSLADRLVTNSAKSNIPDILKEPVAELVMSIDPSSKKLLEKSISTKKDRSFAKVLDGVRRAMNNLDGQNTTAKEVYGAYMDLPDGFVEQLDLFVLGVEGIVESYTDVNPTSVLNQMTAEQLKELNSMLTVINKAISQLGKTVASKRFEYIDDMRQPTMTHLDSLGEGEINSFLEADNLLPFYFFKRLGEGGKAIFESLQDGWDTLSFNAQKIIEFTQKTYTPQEVKVWENDVHTFKDSDNKEFKMTTAQIMSLYCLARREQGIGHILGGGIRIGTFETKDSKLGKAQKFKQSDNYHLSIENAQEIIGTLTDRQRKVAEQLQGFMSSDCAEWGNFVSTKRFGIRLFLEKFYFPIEVVKSDVKIGDEIKRGDGMYSLLNISSTKETIIGANNALVLRNAFDVFANHTADMAKYNALGLPLLDAMKWYGTIDRSKNEDGRVYTRSVRASLEKAYGNPALNYFTQFIKDLNGADEGGRDSGFWKKLISNYKVSKVAANLRVAVLQPVAYVRATTAIDAKYLLRATKNIKDTKSLVKEMETKSGIGGWKSLGFFDTDISRGLREIIKNDVDVTEKIKDKSMKLAEWGDKITWGLLYKACKYEALDKGLGGAALDEYAGNRFREVVYSTQVVDSTMTRSHIMRSRSTFTSMATAFMSEPTMSYNLLLDAYNDVSTDKKQGMSLAQSMKKHGGAICSLATTYCLTATVTAVVEALIDAARDDDDDEYIKKFASELGWNLLDSLSIVNKIPFVKEVRNAILSLIKGYTYSTSRTDVAWLSELSQAISYAKSYFSGDSNMTQYGVTYKLITAVSSVVGLPLGSVMRDVVTVWNNTAGALSPDLKIRRYEQTAVKKAAALDKTEDVKAYIQTLIVEKSEERQQDYPGETATEREKAVTSSVKSTVTSYYKSLYVSAQLVGDTKEMGRIRSKLIQTGLYDDVDKTLSGWLEASKETARKKGVE